MGLIERIKEARSSAKEPSFEEAAIKETPVEETTEAPVEEVAAVEEAVAVEEAAVVEAAVDESEAQSAGLDPSSISELLAENEQGQLSQQEFFRIFLISVQNSLTTNQRLSDVEKKLEETEARLGKVEVAGDSVSVAATEAEKSEEEVPVESVAEEAPVAEEPAEEAPVAEEPVEEEQMDETDITSLVEEAEKLQPKTSRKRSKPSGPQKKSARSKRARV